MMFWLIVFASFIIRVFGNDYDDKTVLTLIYGDRVRATFAGEETLLQAMQLTEAEELQQENGNHTKASAIHYFCENYAEGELIAREYQNSTTVYVYPVLVDFENDVMCFTAIFTPANTVDGSDERSKSLRMGYIPNMVAVKHKFPYHLTHYPAGLNIHENGYNFVENQLRTNHQLDLSNYEMQVFFQTKAFSSDRDYKKNFQTLIDTLPTYDVEKVFGDFFWTAETTAKYFEDKQREQSTYQYSESKSSEEDSSDNAEDIDYLRFKIWADIKGFFQQSFTDNKEKKVIHKVRRMKRTKIDGDILEEKHFEYANNNELQGIISDSTPADNNANEPIYFEFYHYQETLINPEPSEKDICSFTKLATSIEVSEGLVMIPLRVLEEHPDIKDKCLAYLLAAFSSDLSVNFIAIESRPVLLNFRARSIQESGTVGSSLNNQPYTAAGMKGDGQIITIVDSGIDSFSCYFYDSQGQIAPSLLSSPRYNTKYRKIIQYNYNGCGDFSDAEGGHGTHVSGIAAGGINNADITNGDGMYNGVAPNAKISFSDLAKPGSGLCVPSPSELYGPGYAAGARVHSNSWGGYFSGRGYYSGALTDAYLFKNPSLAVFFAAGNSGPRTGMITMESSAKNVLSVGSSQTTLGSNRIDYIAFYSGRGPTYDNRFKPDLVAPGDQLRSAKASGKTNNQTCVSIEMTGTSMATPAAAGTALLVRQYFMDGRFWASVCKSSYRSCHTFQPSAALIRAVFIHSCSPMSLYNGGGSDDVPLGAPPDFNQGFGRVALLNALPLPFKITGYDLFVADAVNIMQDSSITYLVQVDRDNIRLKATIAWLDPPNSQGVTSKALLNDLDLLAISPSGRLYYPNGRSNADYLNNIEKINIANPQTGKWKIVVTSRALPVSGSQLFSLVITSAGSVSYN